MSKPLAAGQWVRHQRVGLGVTVRSDDERTTIDFDEHGPKLFVTSMLDVELTGAPERPPARRRRKAAAAG